MGFLFIPDNFGTAIGRVFSYGWLGYYCGGLRLFVVAIVRFHEEPSFVGFSCHCNGTAFRGLEVEKNLFGNSRGDRNGLYLISDRRDGEADLSGD